ncbi:hypothetical protein CEXT_670321 [Caerostris extrusa]|uniref:Myb-like domain-containing protein n=1 Tax=Caerostris extrusa TaxID=172846 RepID=A0AAV4QB94_CAEEX|nr:hypothetical protein CEXT_670321 [Caerostris extrusa]
MREILDRLNSAMDENSSNEEKLQLLLNEEIAKREMEINRPRFMSRGIFLSPYFQDVHKMVSPLNEDAKMKLKNRDINAYLNLSNIWFDDEINQLMKGVYETSLKYVLKPYTNRLDHLKDKLLDYEIPISEARKFKKEMCSLEKKIKKEGNKPPEEIISEGIDHINWWNVSTIYLHGIRSDEECKTKWNNYTGRSAFQCMQRFKTHIENKNTSNFLDSRRRCKVNQACRFIQGEKLYSLDESEFIYGRSYLQPNSTAVL